LEKSKNLNYKCFLYIIHEFQRAKDKTISADNIKILEKCKQSSRNIKTLFSKMEDEKFIEKVDKNIKVGRSNKVEYRLIEDAITTINEMENVLKEYSSLFSLSERGNEISTIIKNNYFCDIQFDNEVWIKDIKAIGLESVNNNWWVLYIHESKLEYSLINNIIDIEIKEKKFEEKSVEKYKEFQINKFQNEFSLYGVEQREAVLLAEPSISKYFDENMEILMKSHKFKNKEKDGSIKITVKYTQAKEVLPLIKQWLPYLTILEPEELKDELKKDLIDMFEKLN